MDFASGLSVAVASRKDEGAWDARERRLATTREWVGVGGVEVGSRRRMRVGRRMV